jgi:hypothetical protein
VTLASPVTAGNTLIVLVSASSAPTVTDTLGNTFTLIPYGGADYNFYISNSIATGGTDTISISGPTAEDILVLEYTGLPTGSGYSIVDAGVGTELAALGPVTLTTSPSLIILFQYSSTNAFVATGATQRVVSSTDGGGYGVGSGDMVVTGTTPFSFSITVTSTESGAGGAGFLAIGL